MEKMERFDLIAEPSAKPDVATVFSRSVANLAQSYLTVNAMQSDTA